jgi:hypothetical protein
MKASDEVAMLKEGKIACDKKNEVDAGTVGKENYDSEGGEEESISCTVFLS